MDAVVTEMLDFNLNIVFLSDKCQSFYILHIKLSGVIRRSPCSTLKRNIQ